MESRAERQRLHFNSVASSYISTRRNDKNYNTFKALLWNYFFKKNRHYFESRDGIRLLEPMCGTCDGYQIMGTQGIRVLSYSGFDYSDEMVSCAKSLHPGLNIYHGDITSLAPDGEHDAIILIGGLHHVYDHSEKALAYISKSLRRGGIFINFEPTHANVLNKLIRKAIYKANSFFDEETESGFGLGQLNGLFKASGLTVIDQIFPGLLLYCLFYNPDAFMSTLSLSESFLAAMFDLESSLYRNPLGRLLSFATMTCAVKQG
jgi:SAM-dependent methyltransferase